MSPPCTRGSTHESDSPLTPVAKTSAPRSSRARGAAATSDRRGPKPPLALAGAGPRACRVKAGPTPNPPRRKAKGGRRRARKGRTSRVKDANRGKRRAGSAAGAVLNMTVITMSRARGRGSPRGTALLLEQGEAAVGAGAGAGERMVRAGAGAGEDEAAAEEGAAAEAMPALPEAEAEANSVTTADSTRRRPPTPAPATTTTTPPPHPTTALTATRETYRGPTPTSPGATSTG